MKQLRYFEALARHGHFGHAAEVCSISQPALSMQIKELEETLGTPLLERGPKSIRLSPFGAQFLDRARDILRSVDELEDLARAASERLTGRFRLGVIPTIAPYLLPGVIGRLTLQYPDIDLHVRETQTIKLVEELQDGRLDAAILALPVSVPSLEETYLFSEAFVLVRPSVDKAKPVPNRDALREMRLLLLEEGHCFRDQALSFCSIQSALPREALEGSSLTTLVQMVGAGIGVTLVPEMAVPVETRSADVAIARFEEPQPTRDIGIVWRKSSPIGAQLTDIAGIIREAAGHG